MNARISHDFLMGYYSYRPFTERAKKIRDRLDRMPPIKIAPLLHKKRPIPHEKPTRKT